MDWKAELKRIEKSHNASDIRWFIKIGLLAVEMYNSRTYKTMSAAMLAISNERGRMCGDYLVDRVRETAHCLVTEKRQGSKGFVRLTLRPASLIQKCIASGMPLKVAYKAAFMDTQGLEELLIRAKKVGWQAIIEKLCVRKPCSYHKTATTQECRDALDSEIERYEMRKANSIKVGKIAYVHCAIVKDYEKNYEGAVQCALSMATQLGEEWWASCKTQVDAHFQKNRMRIA